MRFFDHPALSLRPGVPATGPRQVLARLIETTRRYYDATPSCARPTQGCDAQSFDERLGETLSTGRRAARAGMLAWIELDGFDAVARACHERTAHSLHDEVLARIARCAPSADDRVGRPDDNTFACLRQRVGSLRHAVAIAVDLLEALSAPFETDGVRLSLCPSIGLACFPRDGATSAALRMRAEAAMRRARHYRMGYAFYSAPLDAAFATPLTAAYRGAHNARRRNGTKDDA